MNIIRVSVPLSGEITESHLRASIIRNKATLQLKTAGSSEVLQLQEMRQSDSVILYMLKPRSGFLCENIVLLSDVEFVVA